MSRSVEIDDMTPANIQQFRVINVATLPVTYSAKVCMIFERSFVLLAMYLYRLSSVLLWAVYSSMMKSFRRIPSNT